MHRSVRFRGWSGTIRPGPGLRGRPPALFFLATALALSAGPAAGQDLFKLRINEILSSNRSVPVYDASGDIEDMVEIYNPAETSISLRDCLLANEVKEVKEGEAVKFLPVNPWRIGSGFIHAGGYLTIFCDGEAGLDDPKYYPHSSFRLDQDGELVALFSPAEELIDLVVFPRIAADTSYGRFPDGADTFCHMPEPSFKAASILSGGSLRGQNKPCGNIPPQIELRAYTSIESARWANPAAGAGVPLLASTWDEEPEGVARASILYKVDGGEEQEVPMVWVSFLERPDPLHPPVPPDPPELIEDRNRSLWKGEIPGLPAGSRVTFTLRVVDKHDAAGTDPRVPCVGTPIAGCTPPYRYRVAYEYQGPLVLNEVLPFNYAVIQDDTDRSFDDYIELHSAVDLDLEGLWVASNPFRPDGGWRFPFGSRIQKGAHLIVWCDDDGRDTDATLGRFHATFNLDNEGEAVFIFDTEANGFGLIDGLKFGATPQDVAWSRCPDGERAAPFEKKQGTPRAENCDSGPKFIRGDVDAAGGLDITDAVVLLNYLFLAGPEPPCLDACDADDTGVLDITDPVTILAYLFQGGAALPAPHGQPGTDLTDDTLGCES